MRLAKCELCFSKSCINQAFRIYRQQVNVDLVSNMTIFQMLQHFFATYKSWFT